MIETLISVLAASTATCAARGERAWLRRGGRGEKLGAKPTSQPGRYAASVFNRNRTLRAREAAVCGGLVSATFTRSRRCFLLPTRPVTCFSELAFVRLPFHSLLVALTLHTASIARQLLTDTARRRRESGASPVVMLPVSASGVARWHVYNFPRRCERLRQLPAATLAYAHVAGLRPVCVRRLKYFLFSSMFKHRQQRFLGLSRCNQPASVWNRRARSRRPESESEERGDRCAWKEKANERVAP